MNNIPRTRIDKVFQSQYEALTEAEELLKEEQSEYAQNRAWALFCAKTLLEDTYRSITGQSIRRIA